jgi:formylglycine-generating enzyme required for sulfatase activity
MNAAEIRQIDGFEWCREEKFECGGQSHRVAIYWHNLTQQEFSLIPAGTFLMGSPEDESGRDPDETQHEVALTKPFLMARTPCTQGAWKKVPGAPSVSPEWTGDSLPVENVSWTDADEWCRKAGLSLPTEAQWEYACRAGTTGRFCFGDNDSFLSVVAWYWDNADRKTHPVGGKAANVLGLYDVHGNVAEWCADWFDEYETGSVTDPTGPSTGSYRVIRGGSWFYDAASCRAAIRDGDAPGLRDGHIGFRPCFVLDEQPGGAHAVKEDAAETRTETEHERALRFFSTSAHDRLPKKQQEEKQEEEEMERKCVVCGEGQCSQECKRAVMCSATWRDAISRLGSLLRARAVTEDQILRALRCPLPEYTDLARRIYRTGKIE